MVRIPAILVGLAFALGLGCATFMLSWRFAIPQLPTALLPVWTALGGMVAGRWAQRPPPVPGFAIGLLVVAVEIGVGLGLAGNLLLFVDPRLALLQVIAAISGGMLGTLLARRLEQEPQPQPEYRPLM
jgi:hypothetical protein